MTTVMQLHKSLQLALVHLDFIVNCGEVDNTNTMYYLYYCFGRPFIGIVQNCILYLIISE